MRFLTRLKNTLQYRDIKGLFVYVSLSVLLLYISFIHPIVFVLFIAYLIFLYKKFRILFYYSLIISVVFLIIYFIHYISYTTYFFDGSIKGVVDSKGDNYIIIKERMHYIKIYTNKVSEFKIGDKIIAYGKEKITADRSVEYTFSYTRYKVRKRIYSEANLTSYNYIKHTISLTSLKGIIIDYIDTKFNTFGGIYIKELVLGINVFDDEVSKEISNLGIIYLFAISGLHIEILSSLITKTLDKLNVPKEIVTILDAIILILYSLITTLSISILRVVIMKVIKNTASLFYIDVPKLDILSYSLLICLLINPFEILSIGFYLTFLSCGIMYLKDNTKFFSTTIIILSFNIPIILYFNHQISLFIVIYSLLFGYIFSYFFIPFTYLTFIFYPLSFIYEGLSSFLARMINISNDLNFTINYSIVNPIMLMLIVFILFKLYKELGDKKKLKFNIGLIVGFIILNYLVGSFSLFPKVKIVDVGQGDSAILHHLFSVAIIDTGEKDDYDTTIKYLKSQNIHTLKYVLISHEDSDHYGEYFDISNNFNVKNFYMYENGLDLRMGSFKIKSYSNPYSTSENDRSMCLYIKVYGQSYFFSGDIEKEGEQYITSLNLDSVTYLKIPHHGSKTSSSYELLEMLKPKVSLIACGLNNKYGHPDKEVLNRLNKYSKDIYRTDLQGSINITHLPFISFIRTYKTSYLIPFDFMKGLKLIN